MLVKTNFFLILATVVILSTQMNSASGQILFFDEATGQIAASGYPINDNGDINYSQILFRPEIRSKIEITEYQETIVMDLIRDIAKANYEAGQEFIKDPSNKLASKRHKDQMASNESRFNDHISGTLVPIQLSQLKSVAFDDAVSGCAMHEIFSSVIGRVLKVTDAEKARLRKRAKEINKELEEKIAELRREARNELFMELPPEKRELLKTKFGVSFD